MKRTDLPHPRNEACDSCGSGMWCLQTRGLKHDPEMLVVLAVQVQCTGLVPTVAIDKVDGCQVPPIWHLLVFPDRVQMSACHHTLCVPACGRTPCFRAMQRVPCRHGLAAGYCPCRTSQIVLSLTGGVVPTAVPFERVAGRFCADRQVQRGKCGDTRYAPQEPLPASLQSSTSYRRT